MSHVPSRPPCITAYFPREASPEWGQDKLREEASRMGAIFPQCMLETIELVSRILKRLGLCVGVWDKYPTKIFASCPVPMEIHSIDDILACRHFKIIGVAPKTR